MMQIGLFQVENLAGAPAMYVFFDLRRERTSTAVDHLLRRAVPANEVQVEAQLASLPKSAPVLLIDENGKTAVAFGRRLEAAGFEQVYVVAGGVEGLLAEL